jgi:peptide/nickel transport system permease protein
MGLRRYAIKRLIGAVVCLWAVITINFLIVNTAPGDPAMILLAGSGTMEWGSDPEIIGAVRARLGLDRPLQDRYLMYIFNILQGDLGYSFYSRRPVLSVIAARIPATVILLLTAETVAIVLGVLIGVISAMRVGRKLDISLSLISSLLYSMPAFWLGFILLLVFGLRAGLFPLGGMTTVGMHFASFWDELIDFAWHLFLPAVTLALTILPVFVRISRASILEVINEDFITTARAIGLKERTVFIKHALRNAMIPTATTVGLYMAYILNGALVVETVFSWPGIGLMAFKALLERDYPLILGSVFVSAIVVLSATFITDLIYAYLDPRISYK